MTQPRQAKATFTKREMHELLVHMLESLDAVREQLNAGEDFLKSWVTQHPQLEEKLAELQETQTVPELEAVGLAVHRLKKRCLAGVEDPERREVAEMVAGHGTSMMLAVAVFLLNFNDYVRAGEGDFDAALFRDYLGPADESGSLYGLAAAHATGERPLEQVIAEAATAELRRQAETPNSPGAH